MLALLLKMQMFDNQLIVSASLPLLRLDSLSRLHYFNQPAFLIFDVQKAHLKNIQLADFQLFKDKNISISHAAALFYRGRKNIFLFARTYKGVPVSGSQFADSIHFGNPLREDFYTHAPLWRVFSYPDFKKITDLSRVPHFSKINYLGYTYTEANLFFEKNSCWQYVPTDGYLRRYDTDNFQNADSILLPKSLREFENGQGKKSDSGDSIFNLAPYYQRVVKQFFRKKRRWFFLTEVKKNGFFGEKKSYEIHVFSAANCPESKVFVVPERQENALIENVWIQNNKIYCLYRIRDKILIFRYTQF
jgi:hypothetical protein